MKTLALVLLAVALLATPCLAETTTKADYSVPGSQGFEDFLNKQEYITHTHAYNLENYVEKDQPVLGGKVDAPNLIVITKNVAIGVEGSKNLVQTNMKEGWEGYMKLTYSGSLLNFSK